MTIAEKISEQFHIDNITGLAAACHAAARSEELDGENDLYVFDDGSSILIISGTTHDISLPCGMCWADEGCQCAERAGG